jgi:germination protein M
MTIRSTYEPDAERPSRRQPYRHRPKPSRLLNSRLLNNRLLKYDTSLPERDHHAREKDRGGANSSAIRATDDVLSCRSARSSSRGFVFQQPAKPMLQLLTAALLVLVLAITAFAVVGCGSASEVGDGGTVSTTAGSSTTVTIPSEETTSSTSAVPSTSTTVPAEDTMKVRVYYSQNEKICALARVVPKSDAVGATAMKALLEGPTTQEKAAEIVSNIPDGTAFLGLEIKDGIATVDLSKEYASGGGSLSMAMRLAEVVFTLTQFPTVEGVNFRLDGQAIDVFGGEGIILDHPVDRSDYEELSPAILVESPTFGETISSPVRVTGTANVFEAVFQLNITDWDGLIVADKTVTATSGTGTRGTFDITVPFEVSRAGLGSIITFVYSAKDGSQENVIEIPLQIEK